MPATSPQDRTFLASLAADASWANTADRTKRTAPARDALEQKWLDQADGDPKRAESLRRAHYKSMAWKSVQARRRAREQTTIADQADAELAELSGDAA